MKPFKTFWTWAFVMLAFVANAQPWTYNFGTTAAAAFSSTTASTTYLPAPSSGTARVRTGGTAGSITLASPGEALGTGAELQMLAGTGSTSTTKFSIHDYTAGNTGYLKFKITLNGGTNGVYTCWVGDGATFSDNNAMANAQVFAGLRWSLGASNVVTYTVSGSTGTFGTTGISNSTTLFAQNLATSYAVELYMNNTAASSTYGRSSVNYSLAAGTWDLWVDGVLVGDDLAKAGLTAAANFDSFAFNHQVSATAPGRIYLDDIEYSNALPAQVACTAPSTQASDITFSGSTTTSLDVTWTNGDGGGRVVYVNSSNSFTAPSNASNPTANLAWAGAGQQCVFNGTGTGPITVTGLAPSTTYYFAVYEYCTPTRNYSTATGIANPNSQTTAAGAALSVNTLTAFGPQCVGGDYGPNSFNVTGVNLSTADVTIGAVAGYAYSTSSAGPFTSTLTISQPGGSFSQDIYVQFSPIAAVAYSGNIAVGGGGASGLTVAVSGSGIAAGAATVNTPTSADLTTTSVTLGATIASTNCSDVTLRGIEWSTTTGFANGAGTQVSESGIFGAGAFTIAVTGLQPNTTYYWKAFATNSTGTTYSTPQQTFTTSQEFLAVGDISILGINTTTPDNFSFVNWVDINPNMIIKFTDNGFNGVAPNSQNTATNARSTENFVIWKNNTGSAIAAGTVIKIEGGTTTTGQIVSGALNGLTSGEQIFAYQGAATTGVFPDFAVNSAAATTFSGNLLYGLNLQGASGTATWITSPTVTSSNTSYLPTELSTAGAAIAIAGGATGSQYTGTRNALGTIAAYKSLVNNPANWTNVTGSTLVTINTTAFTINPNVATQIAITSVNGGVDPSQNQVFSVSVEVRDANGDPAAVGVDTDIALTLTTGTGTLSGTLTGTITAGSGNVVISGVLYNTAQTGVVITAARTSGQSLTSGASAAFTVQATASNLAFAGLGDFGYTLNTTPTFTVQARRDDSTVDVNYTGDVTLTLTTGTGVIAGTVTKPCVAGVASFNDIVFDEAGVKEITAASGSLTSALSGSVTVSTATLTEVVLPQYMEGQTSGSNPNRIPFAYRVTLGGLRPLSTFRYTNSVVIATDAANNSGAGNAIYVTPSGFVRSEGSSLSTAGLYGEFTTDESGTFSGWFITEPTANATRFAAGTDVFPRITLNNGLGGTAAAVRLTTANSVRVLSLGATATDGTALRGESGATPKNFVFAYNNVEGTGRPLSGTFVEADETANTAGNNYSAFYSTSVNGIAGAYGMIIPNTLAAGVRRIETRELSTGDLGGCASTDADGIWPSGTSTVNPSTGTTAKLIANSDAPLSPSPEICDNLIDDDCDGLVDEACPGNFSNDAPGGAPNILYSVNMNYPNCYPISGNNTLANNSTESGAFDGPDSWYRFVAQSTGVSITMTSSTMDDAIALYSRNGLVYTLLASENASTGTGDFERLNFNGLNVGQTYYVSAGASSGTGGVFTICIQHLMPSGCAIAEPVSGFSLCDTYKARYRGAPSQGVTYSFTFTGIGGGASATTTVSGTNGIVTLSNPTLALQWGGEYNAQIDVRYNLLDGAGTAEPIDVIGSVSSANCSNVTMRPHPAMEVRSSQRCPSTLLRSNFLVGDRVSATTPICGVQNYTYEFTQVTSCADGTVVSVAPSTFNTVAATPYLQLGVLPNLTAAGAWDVRIRPNFSYGAGTFGPSQRINVNGTSAAIQLGDEAIQERSILDVQNTGLHIYPNPTDGQAVQLAYSALNGSTVDVRVIDAMGRTVQSVQYAVEGSLNTRLVFENKLAAGLYFVELNDGGAVTMDRMIVE
jgi:hypothetical protein